MTNVQSSLKQRGSGSKRETRDSFGARRQIRDLENRPSIPKPNADPCFGMLNLCSVPKKQSQEDIFIRCASRRVFQIGAEQHAAGRSGAQLSLAHVLRRHLSRLFPARHEFAFDDRQLGVERPAPPHRRLLHQAARHVHASPGARAVDEPRRVSTDEHGRDVWRADADYQPELFVIW